MNKQLKQTNLTNAELAWIAQFEKTKKDLTENKHIHLQKLLEMPFEKLHELEDYYNKRYKNAKDDGYYESAEINFMKNCIIQEAIQVKTGNEEQTWDYLS